MSIDPNKLLIAVHRLQVISNVPFTITDEKANVLYFFPEDEHHYLPQRFLNHYLEYYRKNHISDEMPLILYRAGNVLVGILKVSDNRYIIVGPSATQKYSLKELTDRYSVVLTNEELLHVFRIHTQTQSSSLIHFASILSELSFIVYDSSILPGEIVSHMAQRPVQTAPVPGPNRFNSLQPVNSDKFITFLIKLESEISHGNLHELSRFWENPYMLDFSKSTFSQIEKAIFVFPPLVLSFRAVMIAGIPADRVIEYYTQVMNTARDTSDSAALLGLMMNTSLDCCRMVRDFSGRGNLPDVLRECERYINEHISEKIRVDDLVKVCCISRRRLYSIFEDNYHCTINDFIQNERLRRAVVLIVGSNYTMSEISSSLGFASQSHFITVFKKHFGMTPSEYAASKSYEPLCK